jgi:hypothetical protein
MYRYIQGTASPVTKSLMAGEERVSETLEIHSIIEKSSFHSVTMKVSDLKRYSY